MLVDVIVIPNSKKFSVLSVSPGAGGGRLKIALKSPPENNRANVELVIELSKLFGKPVHLVSGHTARRKKLAVDITGEELMEALKKC